MPKRITQRRGLPVDPNGRTTEGDRRPPAGSRFGAARIEELWQASNDLSEGDEISHADACDLCRHLADELERVRCTYQLRLMALAQDAMKAMDFPGNDKALAPRK